MKRKVGLYIVLLAIIIGGAPYFTGYLVETKFQDVVKVASEFEPVDIAILEYQRGWRKSYAKTRVTFDGKYLQKFIRALEKNATPEFTQSGLSVVLEHEIRHGPFVQLKDDNYRDWLFALASIHSKLFLTERAKEILTSEFGDPELLDLHGEMSIEGDVRSKIIGKALKWKEADGKEHVIFKGLQANWRLTRDMKRFEGELTIPGFDFDWEGKHYSAEGLIFKSERYKSPEGLWLGKGTFTMERMEMQDPKKDSWSVSTLSAGGVIDAESGMIDSSGTLSVEQFKYAGRLWGPMNFALSSKNIEAQVMKALLEMGKKMQMEEQPNPIYVQNIIGLLPQLLKTRPEFHIDSMHVHTDQGDVKGLFNFAVGGMQAHDIHNVPQIIQSIASKANLLLPKTLLREMLMSQYQHTAKLLNAEAQTRNQQFKTEDELLAEVSKKVDETIQVRVADGTLIEKDHSYLLEMELFQGRLKINGKSLDLPLAMATPAMMPRAIG